MSKAKSNKKNKVTEDVKNAELKISSKEKDRDEKKAFDRERETHEGRGIGEAVEGKRPEAEKSGAEQPENKKPEPEKSGAEKPESKKPEAEKSGTEKPESKKPEAEKSGTEKPESKKPEAEKSGTEKPEAEKSGAEKQEAEKEKKEADEKKAKRVRRRRWLAAVLLILPILILAGGYFVKVGYYQTRFLRNTFIDGIACENLEAVTVAAMLDERTKAYCLEVYGRNPQMPEENILLGTIRAGDIGYSDSDNYAVTQRLLENQNAYEWIGVLKNEQHVYTVEKKAAFDEGMLTELLKSWKAFQKENMREAEDAYISGSPEMQKSYVVVAETKSSRFNTEQAEKWIADAILQQKGSINLEETDCYAAARVTAQDEGLCGTVDILNKWLDTVITYDWNGTEVILDRERIWDWVSLEEGIPVLNEEAVSEFVNEQAKQLDTYGMSTKFTTTLGVEVTLPSKYGWKVDRQAEAEELKGLIYEGVTSDRTPIYSIEAYYKGSSEIGPSYVEIDLSNQHLYLYYEGELVLETDFVSGNMSNGNYTPPGIFGLTYKTRNAVLRGANYATPVSYWMPFNGNVGMHDATWRRSFGGNIFLTSGSHGCINLPKSQAEAIYEYMVKGFPVICYYYQPIEEIMAQLHGQPADIPDESQNLDVPEGAEEPVPAEEAVQPEQPVLEEETVQSE